MSAVKYTLAILAATGGAVGAGSQASAATTVNLNMSYSQPLTGITLAGATSPQFAYGIPRAAYEADFDAYGSAAIHSAPYATDPGLPGSGETYDTQSVKTAGIECGVPCSDGYFQLKFNGGPNHYVGTAYVDSGATLETITYQQVGGIPEPDAWALLVVGAGFAGGVMRRNRRQAQGSMA